MCKLRDGKLVGSEDKGARRGWNREAVKIGAGLDEKWSGHCTIMTMSKGITSTFDVREIAG